MVMSVQLKGLAEFQKKLSDEINNITKKSEKGLLEAGKLVIQESNNITPVEFGDLRKSIYTKQYNRGATVEIGYTATYAPYVHEMPMVNKGVTRSGKNAKGSYWGRGENKFLEKALTNNRGEIINLIRKRGKID